MSSRTLHSAAGAASLLIFFLLIGKPAVVAQKIEIEKRIQPEKLPEGMIQWLDSNYNDRGKTRYYEEQNERGIFYEAKFRYGHPVYSIKFYSDGKLYNCERTLHWKELPFEISGKMIGHLDERMIKYRIIQLQEQLAGGGIMGYEMELRGRTANHLGYFEVKFNRDGDLISLQTIQQRLNDYVFY